MFWNLKYVDVWEDDWQSFLQRSLVNIELRISSGKIGALEPNCTGLFAVSITPLFSLETHFNSHLVFSISIKDWLPFFWKLPSFGGDLLLNLNLVNSSTWCCDDSWDSPVVLRPLCLCLPVRGFMMQVLGRENLLILLFIWKITRSGTRLSNRISVVNCSYVYT